MVASPATRILGVLLLLPAVPFVHAEVAANSPETITEMIDSGDAQRLEAAKSVILEWFARGRVPKDFTGTWLPSLYKQKKFEDVASLTLAAVNASPDPKNASAALEYRALALNLLGHTDESLAAAHSAFNVAELRRTDHAVQFILQRFAASLPADEGTPRLIRQQQALGSKPAPDSDPSHAVPSPALLDIKIDDQPYLAAIDDWKKKESRISDRLKYGNLLLIAGKGQDAEKIFRSILASANSPQDHAAAVDGVARALKTQDATLARANAWIAAQTKAPAPSANLP